MTNEQRKIVTQVYGALQREAEIGLALAETGTAVQLREHAEVLRKGTEEMLKALDFHIGASSLIDRIERPKYPQAKVLSESRRSGT